MLHRALREYMEHYHLERNHQGLDNKLISSTPIQCSILDELGQLTFIAADTCGNCRAQRSRVPEKATLPNQSQPS
jgi:hypothetical protein